MGCESMSATIVKGPVHQAIDDLVNRDATTRATFLGELKALPPGADHTGDYLNILRRHAPQLEEVNDPLLGPVRLLDYLHDAWYNPKDQPDKPFRFKRFDVNGFWPLEHHPTEPVIRQGLIAALELATEKQLPLDSYWVATGDRVETLVLCTPQQITRLLMTPPGPAPHHPNHLMNFADIRVIKRGTKEAWETLMAPHEPGQVITTQLMVMPPIPRP
jgi:hypothetical protein